MGSIVDSALKRRARDRVTVDLCDLRPQLQRRAAAEGTTAAALMRRAIATFLEVRPADPSPDEVEQDAVGNRYVKVTLRIPFLSATLIRRRSRVRGLSQGAYVAYLVEAQANVAMADHRPSAAALLASNDRLATLNADLNAFVRFLRAGRFERVEQYRGSMESLAEDVRHHLALAAELVQHLKPGRRR